MSKSVPTILVLGGVGVVMLTLMMQHLVDVRAERERSPYAPAVEVAGGARLIGAVRVDAAGGAEVSGAPQPRRFRIEARVVAGGASRAMAESMGEALWLGAMRAGDRPAAVEVVLTDEDDVERRFDVTAPARGR